MTFLASRSRPGKDDTNGHGGLAALPRRPWSARRWDGIAILLLLLVTLPWWQGLHAPFTLIDDPLYVTENPDVLGGLNLHTIATAFSTDRAKFYLPMTWLSLALDASLFGKGPAGFHFTNITLHIANSLLLYAVLRSFTHDAPRSLLVAALFALHPLRVESVAWVTERKDVLAGFFGLLGMLAYGRYAQATRRRLGWYLLWCLLFALSLLAKPMLVALPCLLLLLNFWPLRRLQSEARGGGGQARRLFLLEMAPPLAISAAVTAINCAFQMRFHALAGTASLSIASRLENALVSYGLYLRDHFYFGKLSVFYPAMNLTSKEVLAAFLVLAITTGTLLWLWRRRPSYGTPLLVGWLWFLGMLAPMIGLLQSGQQSRADRFTYFPSIGLFILLVWLWPIPLLRSLWKPLPALAAAACVVVLAVHTSLRIRLWTDPVAMYRDGLAHTENNFFLEFMVGRQLQLDGNIEGSIDYYSRAVTHQPWNDRAHDNLGVMLLAAGRKQEALRHFQIAEGLNPLNDRYEDHYQDALAALQPATTRAAHGALP